MRRAAERRRRSRRVLAPLVGLALASAASAAAEEQVAGAVPGLAGAQALETFFTALADLKAGRRTTSVQVLQIGDSHTAADHIGSGVRARLQSVFGEGGRGVLPPGVPFAAYAPRQIAVEQSAGWRQDASFPTGYGRFGLSGWRLTSTRPGATVTLTADRESLFDRAVACAMSGPGAGELRIAAGATQAVFPLESETAAPVCTSLDFVGPQSLLQLTAEGGPVTLLSFAVFRQRSGLGWSNLGIIGARLADFAARDDGVLAAELAAYAPDLIVLAFGTNDGFDPEVDPAGYQGLVQAQVRRMRRLAPRAAVLILGAPDAQLVRPDIPRDGIHNVGFSCAPLTPEETANYAALVESRSPALARWYAPPMLTVVREAQRRAAAAEGAAFWDWEARMGGPCTAHRLSRPEVDLMRGDHIHFKTDGGDMIARLLTDDLMAAYAARVASAPPAPVQAQPAEPVPTPVTGG